MEKHYTHDSAIHMNSNHDSIVCAAIWIFTCSTIKWMSFYIVYSPPWIFSICQRCDGFRWRWIQFVNSIRWCNTIVLVDYMAKRKRQETAQSRMAVSRHLFYIRSPSCDYAGSERTAATAATIPPTNTNMYKYKYQRSKQKTLQARGTWNTWHSRTHTFIWMCFGYTQCTYDDVCMTNEHSRRYRANERIKQEKEEIWIM